MNARRSVGGARPVTYDELIAEPHTRGPADAMAADIVAVSTPPQCQSHDAIHLLDAGVAVLLEKPLCGTLAEADSIVEAS